MANKAAGLKKGEEEKKEGLQFDIAFERAILKIALQDDHFSNKLVNYFSGDKISKDYKIFANDYSLWLFSQITKSIKQYGTRPSRASLRQNASEMAIDEQPQFYAFLDSVESEPIHDEDYFRDKVKSWVKAVKSVNGVKNFLLDMKKDSDKAMRQLESAIEEARSVDLNKENVIDFSNFKTIYSDLKANKSSYVPTGIHELDATLGGGLPKGCLTVVLGATNSGKSMFVKSLGTQALNRGFTVIHINLEGPDSQPFIRYTAELCQISSSRLKVGDLTQEEEDRAERIMKNISERLHVRNMNDRTYAVDEVCSYISEVVKKWKKPDLIIIDYGQLLKAKGGNNKQEMRHNQSEVFHEIGHLARKYQCAVVSPVQGTRGAQEELSAAPKKKKSEDRFPILRSHHISEAFEIARMSEVILTISSTPEEMDEDHLRIYLEKQRDGRKDIQFGLVTNFGRATMITGETYDIAATIASAGEEMAVEETVDLTEAETAQNKVRIRAAIDAISAPEQKQEKPTVKTKHETTSEEALVDSLITEYKTMGERLNLLKEQMIESGQEDEEKLSECLAIKDKRKTLRSMISEKVNSMYPKAQEMLPIIKAQVEELKKGDSDINKKKSDESFKLLDRLLHSN